MAGLPIDWVVGLDLISFDSLSGSINRELARRDYQNVINQRFATNGEGKDFKSFLQALETRAELEDHKESDVSRLIRDIGKGV
jgi:hypothetical protein